MFTIIKGKGEIRNCSCYGVVMLLEHGMKVMDMVFGEILHRIAILSQTDRHQFKNPNITNTEGGQIIPHLCNSLMISKKTY